MTILAKAVSKVMHCVVCREKRSNLQLELHLGAMSSESWYGERRAVVVNQRAYQACVYHSVAPDFRMLVNTKARDLKPDALRPDGRSVLVVGCGADGFEFLSRVVAGGGRGSSARQYRMEARTGTPNTAFL